MSQESSKLNDSDMDGALAALKRAAKRARLIAAQTGTEIVVRRDGKLIREFPSMSEFEKEDVPNQQVRAESATESTKKVEHSKNGLQRHHYD